MSAGELSDYVLPPPDGVAVGPGEQATHVADAVMELSRAWSLWVRRRVVSVRFADDATVRTQTSVDFQVPRAVPHGSDLMVALGALVDRMVKVTAEVPVPIATSQKATFHPGLLRNGASPNLLTAFDLWSESGQRLPMLGKREADIIVGEGLARYAQRIGQSVTSLGAAALPPEVLEYFREIVRCDSAGSSFLLSNIDRTGAPRLKAVVRKMGLTHLPPSVQKLVPKLYGANEATIATLLTAKNWGLEQICRTWSEHFVILVAFPSEAAYQHHIVKLSQHASISQASARKRRLADLGSKFSWMPEEFMFSVHDVGATASHHFEVEAPESTEIISTDLLVTPAEPGAPTHTVMSDRSMALYGHVRLTEEAFKQPIVRVGVKLRATRAGLLSAGAVTAVMVAGAFWAARPFLQHADEAAAATVLLAVPALVVSYLIRPGEHALRAGMLSGVRVLLGITALCLFAGAGAFALGFETATTKTGAAPSRSQQHASGSGTGPVAAKHNKPNSGTSTSSAPRLAPIWTGLSIIASVTALLVVLSWLLPRRKREIVQNPTEGVLR